ncbi:MAG: DUF2157 domain-containing protein [Thermoanaerobaculia bacterium]
MFSLEPELEALRPRLGDAATNAMIARERREVFSVYPELRIAGWLGATLLAAAAGVLLKDNLDRIGPLALAILIGVAAIACYAWTWWRRARASVVDDYVLLLGALLVSADVAFIEAQFHLFDDAWKRHLLLLTVVHAAGAYAYRSRMLLSLAITALGGYLGFDKDRGFVDVALPAFELAALLIAWRAIDAKLPPTANRQPPTVSFSRTFEHFAANAALVGGLSLIDDHPLLGGLLTIAIAVAVVVWGFRTRHEPFVLYGVVYGIIAADWMILELVDGNPPIAFLVILVSMIAAVAGLLFLHARFKEPK